MAPSTKTGLQAELAKLRRSLAREKAKGARQKKERDEALAGQQATAEMLEVRNRDFGQALDQQTATAEILRALSSSPTDLSPVMRTLAESAARLCEGTDAHIWRREGDYLQAVASHGSVPIRRPRLRIGRDSVTGRAVLDCTLVHVHDLAAVWEKEFPDSRAMVESGHRSVLAVPLVREGHSIGAILIRRTEVRPFAPKHLALLETFADQAVIAIENTRLFNETKEALERQSATAEILKVISDSPTDVRPVFDAIVQSAVRLCDAVYSAAITLEGGMLHLVAYKNWPAEGLALARRLFPMPVEADHLSAIAVRENRVIHQVNLQDDPQAPATSRELAIASGYQSLLIVPMVREGRSQGVVVVARKSAFTNDQIALLQTFADQAVIAIDNVRLFNQTNDALERQTATAEVLKVISSSPTDVQPVFDAVAANAARLCVATDVVIQLVEGDVLRSVAHFGSIPYMPIGSARPISRGRVTGHAVLEGKQIHVHDLQAASDQYPEGSAVAEELGTRTTLVTPLLREGAAVGTIFVRRTEARSFSDKQLELVRTFADQAVIAIENTRLFNELQQRTRALTKSVGQLTALGEVGQAISSTLDLDTVLKTIVSRAVQLAGLDGGSIYEYNEQAEEFILRATENVDEEYLAMLRQTPIRKGEGAVGRAALTGEPVQIPDVLDASYQTRLREALIRAGYRAVLVVPLRREEHTIGALAVTRKVQGTFAPEVVELLKTFATQSALAIQNARLFREIEDKGRQLEVASRHKSDFLASMSHELRTPLNAILGFNEMILGEIYGEVPADMQTPLAQMQTSGKHLLRLINNVLDLAKIEAGRMELALADYAVQDLVESVRSTLRPLAADKGLEFLASVPQDIPLAYGDSGRLTQCLMNLAGNSLKFTKAGKVEITVECQGDVLVYRVADTGIGIPPDKIGSLFTEFKQTDATVANEYGGTGLGLSISRKFVEMHGGRIWVESEPGRGSTFIFEIPLRAGAGAQA